MTNLINSIKNNIIKIESTNLNYDFIDPYKTPEQNSSVGTGFFILEKESGYILTCCHVVRNSINIQITIPSKGKNKYNAEIICVSEDYDLALLKTEYKNNNYLEFFDSDNLEQGDSLSALGYPLGQERLKISNGILSGYEKYFLQTDAAINEGNSGGPLIKENKVVGINAKKIKSILANNIGYAVPIKLFMILKDEFFNERIIKKVNLLCEIKITDDIIRQYYNNNFNEGILITRISERSCFYKIGLRQNDVLIKFDNYEINNYGEITFKKNKFNLHDFIYRYKNNQKIIIEYYSKVLNKIEKIEVELDNPKFNLVKIIPSINSNLIKYEIISGLVFSDLNLNQIDLFERYDYQFGNNGNDFINLLNYEDDFNKFENKVILTSVLKGSEFINNHKIFSGVFLEKFNDKKINTLNDLKENLLESKRNNVKFYKFEFSNNHIIIMNFELIKNDYKKLKKLYNLSSSIFIENFLGIYKLNYDSKNNYSNYEKIVQSVIDKNYGINDLLKKENRVISNKINKGFQYINE